MIDLSIELNKIICDIIQKKIISYINLSHFINMIKLYINMYNFKILK